MALLPEYLPPVFAKSDGFKEAVAERLKESSSTYADADTDVVDGSLEDVIEAVLRTL